MVLFTHLKITLLQYFSVFSFSFQFQFSVFSCFQTDPKSISDLFSKFLYNLENEQWLLSFSYSVFQIHFSIDSISHSLSHLNIIFSFILYSYSNLCRWNVLDDFQLLRFISIQFPRLRLRLFFFFFFTRLWDLWLLFMYCAWTVVAKFDFSYLFSANQCTPCTVHRSTNFTFQNFFIKNVSHGTIHTFKIYLTIVFFSFQF